jgi:hypothetical protein
VMELSSKDGNSSVCQNVGQLRIFDMGCTRKSNFCIERQPQKPKIKNIYFTRSMNSLHIDSEANITT